MKTKKYLTFIATMFVTSLLITAQSRHEITVYGGAGLGTIKNKTNGYVSDKKNGFGGNFGVGYTYFITPQFGLQTGLEYAMYSSKMKVFGLEGEQETTDNEGDILAYKYSVDGLQEKQNVGMIQIPIMAHYQVSIGEMGKYYASAGAKIGFATSKKFEHTGFRTTALYPELNAVIDDFAEQGFGKFNYKTKGDLSLKTAILLSVETGVKWTLTDQLDLHTGIYLDYGLNNINKYKSKDLTDFVTYNKVRPGTPNAHSVTETFSQETGGNKAIVDKLTPMAIGIKIKLGFAL